MDRTRPTQLLAKAPGPLVPGAWSPDGRVLIYHEVHADRERDLLLFPSEGEPTPFLVTEFNELGPRLSPDGDWVVYVSDQTGENRIYAQPFPGGGAAVPISTGPGTEAVWSRDGREIFYRNGDRMLVVPIGVGPDLVVGTPNVLFEGTFNHDPSRVGVPNYDVSTDGQWFLMVRTELDEGPPQLNVVLNWFEELKARVPVPWRA